MSQIRVLFLFFYVLFGAKDLLFVAKPLTQLHYCTQEILCKTYYSYSLDIINAGSLS